jgi:CHAD domain-containing protein
MLSRVLVSTQLISQRSAPNRAARALARAARDRRVLTGAAATAGAAVAAAGVARELMTGDEPDRESPASGAYRIKNSESAVGAVTRIASECLDHALGYLETSLDDDPATAVHEARKDLKKTRSILRLVRDPLGEDVYRRENDRLRDAGRELSGTRDATVKADTLEALRERYGDEIPDGAKDLGATLEEEQRALSSSDDDRESELQAAARRASGLIAESRKEVDDWSFSKSGFKLIATGLERSYRRGHKRFADVRSDPTSENVHEWRKRVKDLWYDLRLLRDTWPPIVGEMADQSHELSDLLGDHHDLTVLSQDLDGRSAMDGDDAAALQALIEGRQEELLEAAVPIGERLYAESPKKFVERLHAYWRARDGH